MSVDCAACDEEDEGYAEVVDYGCFGRLVGGGDLDLRGDGYEDAEGDQEPGSLEDGFGGADILLSSAWVGCGIAISVAVYVPLVLSFGHVTLVSIILGRGLMGGIGIAIDLFVHLTSRRSPDAIITSSTHSMIQT